jgi:hypothetical protein
MYLWFLILSFSMVLAISNWYDARLIFIFGIVVTPGTLLYPITFLLSDVITEVYGFKHARRAVLVALLFNSIFISYGKILVHLPSPSFPNNNDALDKLIHIDFWIILASFSSLIISEILNSYLVAKLKMMADGKYIGLRFITSTIISTSIDTPLFVFIAFNQTMGSNEMITLIYSIWLIKCIIEIALLPFTIKLAKVLKQKEQLNIFDINTNFNPLSIDVDYPRSNNKYKKEHL